MTKDLTSSYRLLVSAFSTLVSAAFIISFHHLSPTEGVRHLSLAPLLSYPPHTGQSEFSTTLFAL